MVKLNKDVSSSRRKQRKAHFGATSDERRSRMAAPLDANLRKQWGVKSVPVKKGDEVIVKRGKFAKMHKDMSLKVTACYRKKYVIHVEKCIVEKSNKQAVNVGIDASNVMITKLEMDGSRSKLLKRKAIKTVE